MGHKQRHDDHRRDGAEGRSTSAVADAAADAVSDLAHAAERIREAAAESAREAREAAERVREAVGHRAHVVNDATSSAQARASDGVAVVRRNRGRLGVVATAAVAAAVSLIAAVLARRPRRGSVDSR